MALLDQALSLRPPYFLGHILTACIPSLFRESTESCLVCYLLHHFSSIKCGFFPLSFRGTNRSQSSYHQQPTKRQTMALLDQSFFHYSLLTFYLLGLPTFIALRFFQFPYGKHNRLGWGPTISPPLAWFLMESPTIFLPLILFPFGQHFTNPKALVLMSPFLLHYFHRTFMYPLRVYQSTTQQKSKTTIGFPLILTFNGFVVQGLNTYLQARWVSHYKSDYDSEGALFWWKFFGGLVLFLWGMRINMWSDKVLLGLKRESGGYKAPRGGWFEFVSCPNYFGEIVEWLGWAVMTCSWVGFGFFLLYVF